jgi:CRP-like cAMP-binding protein
MSTIKHPLKFPSVLSTRLARLAALTTNEVAALEAAESHGQRLAARGELTCEGMPVGERRGLLSGWAMRQRILIDGQRQVVSFLVPGDLIGNCHHADALAATTTLAVTEITTCLAPVAVAGSALAEAYARSAALEEHYLIAQITRIGRLDAYDRIADWLLETRDRLAAVGLATENEFALPLTQELLADALGLTSVHVNRMLQELRRDGLLALQAGVIRFPDRRRLEDMVDFKPARVSSSA